MTNEAKKIARLRLLKRIGVIGLITSGAIGLVFLILSLLPQGNAAFTIRIDNPASVENTTFKIFQSSEDAEADTSGQTNKNGTTYLAGDPMPHTALTESKAVENYLRTVTEFKGNNNFRSDTDKDLAMVYTIYLTNQTKEEISVQYAVRLDAFKETTDNTSGPIEYFRVLVQTEEVGNPSSLQNKYYGQKRSGRFEGTYVFDNEDGRETISAPKTYLGDDLKTHVTLDETWSSPGNDGYCINFADYHITNDIVNSEVVVPVGKAIRYTFVAYFDGGDIDSYARAQNDDYLLISLHFGV